MFSNMKWKIRIYLFEDKLKWIVEIIYAWIFWSINSLWNLYVKVKLVKNEYLKSIENHISVDILKYKFTMEFIKERGICLK